MSVSNPEVSVIIPAHNAASHLADCLDSVLRQSFTDWEMIIADDGSDDDTGKIADEYASTDSRIRVIHRAKSGVSSARNTCIEEARGTHLAFVDADDLLEQDYLKELVSCANLNNADIAQCSFSFLNADGTRTADPYGTDKIYHGNGEIMDGFAEGPVGKIRVSVWAKLFRRETFDSIRFDTELNIYEDAYYTYLCCAKAEIVSSVSTPLYLYRQHDDSVMHSNLAEHYDDYFKVFDKQLEDLKNDPQLFREIAKRKSETSLWLMRILSAVGDKGSLWKLRKSALKNAGAVMFSSSPFLLKTKLAGVAVMPHLYFTLLKKDHDRNALFNIAVKCILFAVTFAAGVLLCRLALGISLILSCIISLLPALAVIFLFSFLLRYTRFYYRYYSFVSSFLYKKKIGKVYCPCCGKHFDSFHDERFYADTAHFNPDIFMHCRQDVICDFCRSAPRHRIIAEWAQKNTGLLKSSEILYFAPELSMMLWFKRNSIRPKTADLYDRRTDLKLDITSLDLPDESFDVVFCNHVLEHVSDYNLALNELHRIIRKGGTLIISFPIDSDKEHVLDMKDSTAEDRIRVCGQHDHLRIFGKDSKEILENAGFEVDIINTTDMPSDIVPVTGPADYDSNKIFCCIRK